MSCNRIHGQPSLFPLNPDVDLFSHFILYQHVDTYWHMELYQNQNGF